MAFSYPSYYPQQPYPYQEQLSQLRSTPMFQPVQSRPDTSGLNWVQGEAGAKSWFVTPGSTVLLMDSESQRFYLKMADPSGVPTMRTFEYTEVGAQKPQETAQTASFVTVDVFNNFRSEVMGRLEELYAPVEVSLSRKKKGESNE